MFPLYLYWRKDKQKHYDSLDMDALILSSEPMTRMDTIFGYYYKMNPSGMWGIYFDFLVHFVQSLVVIIWPLNLILVPIQWTLQLTKFIQTFFMSMIFPYTGLPYEFSSIQVNIGAYMTFATVVNYVNLPRYFRRLVLFIWN